MQSVDLTAMVTLSLLPRAIEILGILVAAVCVPFALFWIVSFVIRLVGGLLRGIFGILGAGTRRVGRLVRGMFVDTLNIAGGALTAGVILPLSVANLLIGRGRAAAHYGRALEDEFLSIGQSLYRVALGHPVRFLGLGALTDGLERRLPDLVSRAPHAKPGERRRPEAAAGPAAQGPPSFEGYRVVGTLPAGGSGAKLFLAQPSTEKRAAFAARGHQDPGQVVIKSFALDDGSTLPQIVRESRALEAAKRLGLVLDHELAGKRFHYVMPFVPGDDLDAVTRRLHARAGTAGLDGSGVTRVLGFGCDLAQTLDRFHREGLWHKDIKPSNLIVSGDRLHLVDLGLVTPLASALTLTTHGTEYFRDPEMVRLAMQGVKVHEVDGVKFDLYSAGAVLYSMIENSFPAHGSLSRISKRCPDALAWIIRRCMADMATRYRSADELGQDVAYVLAAQDPFAVLPAHLPSISGRRFDPRRIVRPRAAAASMPAESSASTPGSGPAPAGVPDDSARRVRRGVGAAALATAAFAVGLGGIAATFATHRDRGPAHVWGSDQLRTIIDRHVAQAPLADLQPGTWGAASTLLNGLQGDVLLFVDPGVTSDHPEVTELREHLEARGLRVLGPDAESRPEDADRALDLTARAHRAVGLTRLEDEVSGSTEAVEALRRLLRREASLGAILWIERSPTGLLVRVVRD